MEDMVFRADAVGPPSVKVRTFVVQLQASIWFKCIFDHVRSWVSLRVFLIALGMLLTVLTPDS